MAKRPDVIFLQELHPTRTAASIWKTPEGYPTFYSYDTGNSASVGILVANKFLTKFLPHNLRDAETEHLLEDICPGRLARLRLTGPEGNLHLVVVYFTTGDAVEERQQQRALLAQHLPHPSEARVLVAGDFNYTSLESDRGNLLTGGFGKEKITKEEEEFQRLVACPAHLMELEQPEAMHRAEKKRIEIGPSVCKPPCV